MPSILAIHGGCFTGGKPTYQEDVNLVFEKYGLDVIRAEFSLDDVDSALQDLEDQLQSDTIGVLGRSSGGYLAKILHDRGMVSRAIYVAPVFQPLLRGELVPHLGAKYGDYFSESYYPTDSWDPENELLYLAHEDTHVPRQLFTEEQLEHARYPGPRTHLGLIKSKRRELIEEMVEFFTSDSEGSSM